MKNLNAKEQITLLENVKPIQYLQEADMLDTPLTERFFEFMRAFQWIHNTAMHVKGSAKNDGYMVSYAPYKSKTTYDFIINGLPGGIQAGLKKILKVRDDEERYAQMIRFEAIVRLVTLKKIRKFWEITEEMISEQIEMTKRLEPEYNESDWTFELKSVFGSEACTVEAKANDYSKTLG